MSGITFDFYGFYLLMKEGWRQAPLNSHTPPSLACESLTLVVGCTVLRRCIGGRHVVVTVLHQPSFVLGVLARSLCYCGRSLACDAEHLLVDGEVLLAVEDVGDEVEVVVGGQ